MTEHSPEALLVVDETIRRLAQRGIILRDRPGPPKSREELIDDGTLIPASEPRRPLPPLIDIGPHEPIFDRERDGGY